MTKGILIPFSVFFIVLLISGLHVFFYKWAIEFGIFYLPRAGGQVLLPTLKQLAISMFPFVILAPLIFQNKKKDADLIIWSVFAGLGVYPRFELFHFQPAMPFLAIGAAIVILQTFKNPKIIFRIALAGYLLILLVISGRFAMRNWDGEARFYGQEEKNVSSFVKSSVDPEEEIYVLNYWDSIYAMTDTLPATRPLIPYLPWYLEYEDKTDGIIRDLITDMPELVVKGEYSGAGLGSYSIDRIDTLLERYYTLAYKKANMQIYRLNR